MTDFLLNALAPVLVGPLTFFVVQGAKSASGKIDALSPAIKRIAVLVAATGLTVVGDWAKTDFRCAVDATDCLANIDTDAAKSAVSAAIALLLHRLKRAKGRG